MLQAETHARMSLQHMLLRKKMHELHMKYLSSDVQANLLV